MTNRTPRTVIAAVVATFALVRSVVAQSERDPGNSIVIVTGQLATLPIPTLMEGARTTVANLELADQLFLRLVGLGPTMLTAGDRNFVPQLARSWTRRDSVTLAFDLDPRARWHDGVPVTARDVVFTLRPGAEPGDRSPAGPAAEADHLGDRRRRSPRRVPLLPSLCGAALRRHLSCRPDPGPPAGVASAGLARPFDFRHPSGRRRAIPPGAHRPRDSSWSWPPTRISSWASPSWSGSSTGSRPTRMRASTCC